MTVSNMPLLQRLWFSWLFGLRVLFDGRLASRAHALLEAGGDADALPAPVALERSVVPASPVGSEQTTNGGLQLLSLLQREGRFVDFVQQDITSFSDADVGAAARVVHEGCQRALRSHARVRSVRDEAEGARVTLERAADDVKLVGNVAGAAPFRGVLRHRGWRVEALKLPTVVGSPDLTVVAPAELELS